jgi:hypothetical protein
LPSPGTAPAAKMKTESLVIVSVFLRTNISC